jgi:hypothetical protein
MGPAFATGAGGRLDLLLVAAALWATVILIDHLINGAPQTNSAGFLLASGVQVLVGNNLAFALLYWQFDSGGPLARLEGTTRYPDFAVPEPAGGLGAIQRLLAVLDTPDADFAIVTP